MTVFHELSIGALKNLLTVYECSLNPNAPAMIEAINNELHLRSTNVEPAYTDRYDPDMVDDVCEDHPIWGVSDCKACQAWLKTLIDDDAAYPDEPSNDWLAR